MRDFEKVIISPDTTIMSTIEVIDRGVLQIAIVVDEDKRLIGTVTDGDIRRAIIKKIPLDEEIKYIMNKNPYFAELSSSKKDILSLMKRKSLRQMPIVDDQHRVVNLLVLDDLLEEKKVKRDNWVVLMVGGLGSRLYPLTEHNPKPLLKIGSKPILERIIHNFAEYGFVNFYLAVNYKKEQIIDYFGDGSRFGVNIQYIEENEKLGTAGPLSLLPEMPNSPVIVMNGDLLTKVNFDGLLRFHIEHNSQATMCVREYQYEIPYGVVNTKDHRLISIEEKPSYSYFVNAGIYVLNPNIIPDVPYNSYYDMPTLFEKLVKEENKVCAFPVREYWLDIGRMSDFERANVEYAEVFNDNE
ncbi:nucleotidyltransferase family protein [Paenibacillus thermotolerans]|uniref:nucleotidyltransferase family protein n=1 Tax=Paenibacillus thermotolerans TaxID=3027807 RepID=UPI00236759E3|nr:MULTISPECIES: nucleotidyltransferase family protein [unclassified Paenibacillus]